MWWNSTKAGWGSGMKLQEALRDRYSMKSTEGMSSSFSSAQFIVNHNIRHGSIRQSRQGRSAAWNTADALEFFPFFSPRTRRWQKSVNKRSDPLFFSFFWSLIGETEPRSAPATGQSRRPNRWRELWNSHLPLARRIRRSWDLSCCTLGR